MAASNILSISLNVLYLRIVLTSHGKSVGIGMYFTFFLLNIKKLKIVF